MENESINNKIKLKDLPPHLQRKYKNSILFEKENLQQKAKKYYFDLDKLK